MTRWRVSLAVYSHRFVALSAAMLLTAVGCAGRHAPAEQPLSTEAISLEALVEVMGQRLAVMPRVAEWKRAHDRPVRDRPREAVVLDKAFMAVDEAARKAGVKPFPEEAVRRFYQAQIDTAVGIQEKILSQPPRPNTKPPDLSKVIRPELDRLGARIADLLVVLPGAPDRSRLEHLARRHWQVEGLEPDAITRLVDALERLFDRRNAPPAGVVD